VRALAAAFFCELQLARKVWHHLQRIEFREKK